MLPSHEEHIERAAEIARERWGIHNQTCPCVITMIYKLKHDGTITNYAVVPDAELPDDEAEYDPYTRMVTFRESTFQAANDLYGRPAKTRARFTCAHEIGHIVLKHKRVRHRNVSDRKIERILVSTRVDESEANRFAGALLMPRHLIRLEATPTAEEIAQRFQVSEFAARIRLEELLRSQRRKEGIKRPAPNAVREFLLEARNRGMKIKSLDDE